MKWPLVVSSEKGYFEGRVILSQSCCGYSDYDCNIYLKLFFYQTLLGAYFGQILGYYCIHYAHKHLTDFQTHKIKVNFNKIFAIF